ncbi:S-adenosyl-methyltransferase [Dokdonia sp. Dokd-P16]|uniref:FtsL-like putative cell division protein n=1 Tax=Dokdonia sp. Dokd-P16 TaxID=2173169 RepID=UPI000D5474E6|nr:FtsL-like putative cell division protein [Dokdonia sp. Dokd-P16]AWH73049.1 S-adenosyl-methyltransferase [Dokdonia sp. Dokd-P16]
MSKFNNILKGKFLVDEDAFKNWRMIIFISVLALIMIASSHRADEKVYEIARLKEEVAELRSEAVDSRVNLWKLKTNSSVARALEARGIKPSNVPPKKIKVTTQETD